LADFSLSQYEGDTPKILGRPTANTISSAQVMRTCSDRPVGVRSDL
jgi:hypothetical protein